MREQLFINGKLSFVSYFEQIKYLCGYYNKGKREDNPETIDNIVNNTYITIHGTRINCFIAANCGRCPTCKDTRRREYESRALFEAADNPYMYFFTLTYSDVYLHPQGLYGRDVSNFLKRFRTNLERAYSTKFNVDIKTARSAVQFRCLYVGEYGSKTKRPHYHGILFFKNYIPDKHFFWLRDIFRKSWGMSSLPDYVRDFERILNPAAAARYVTKYITKADINSAPQGKTPCFIRGPHKCGLGASNLGYHLQDILNSKDNCVYLNIAGKVVRTKIPKFLIQKIFPTFSRKYGSINDLFWSVDQARAEMICRVDNDPFTHCYDPRKYDSILQPFEYLRLGSCQSHTKKVSKHVSDLRAYYKTRSNVEALVNFLHEVPDERLNEIYTDLILSLSSSLPSQEEFFREFSPKLVWQSQLQIYSRTYEEKMCISEKKRFNNENFVRKRLLNEKLDLSLQTL